MFLLLLSHLWHFVLNHFVFSLGLSRWPVESGRDAVCTVLSTCSQGEITAATVQSTLLHSLCVKLITSYNAVMYFTILYKFIKVSSATNPTTTLQIQLLIIKLRHCSAAEWDLLCFFSCVFQKQTENALCHQTPDRRTSEQLKNLQGETQPQPHLSVWKNVELFNHNLRLHQQHSRSIHLLL